MQVQTWKSELNKLSELFENSFAHLSDKDLNYKINPSNWSIAQNIEHIILTNETYYPVIKKLSEGNYTVNWFGRMYFVHNFFAKMIYNSVKPENRKKIKTFPIWEPTQSSISNIINRLHEHHIELIHIIESNKSLFGQNLLIKSPANKFIVYALDRAIDIIIAHEYRHYQQSIEILKEMRS